MVAVVIGSKRVDRTLAMMRTTAARRAMSLGTRKAAMQMAKDVKNTIPSRYKGVRKAIGYRSLKKREAPGGGAKVGAAVGKGKITQKDRTGLKGVGIDRRNIHWWFLGTKDRKTGKKGGPIRHTGAMPAQGESISVVIRKRQGKTQQILREWVWVGIKKEVAKGKAF